MIPDKEPWELEMEEIEKELQASLDYALNSSRASPKMIYQILLQYRRRLHKVLRSPNNKEPIK